MTPFHKVFTTGEFLAAAVEHTCLPAGRSRRKIFSASGIAEMELDLGDGRLLVFDGDPMPEDELPLFSAN